MRLFIYCAGGIGRETYDIAKRADPRFERWSEICFIDDNLTQRQFYNAPLFNYGQFRGTSLPDECRVVIAIGEPRLRKTLAERVRGDRYTLESIVDPTAQVSPSAHYGLGIILFPHTYLSSCSDIGDNVLINAGSIVGHDTCIGENTVVSPLVSVSGICSIGSDSFIGTGACIKEKVSVGARTIVGMGACVFRDIGPGMIVVGNPARESRQNIDQRVFRSTK